jgi:transcriptional repressor NrdR
MQCPYCGQVENRVIDSRLTRESQEIRRRRECAECERRFTTRERVEQALPKIIKRDERREEYDRAKLEDGATKACVKRPVSENALQRLLDRVERRLQESGEAEVPTAWVGDLLLSELLALDTVAATRFASVFRRFQSADDYVGFWEKEVADAADSAPAADTESES